ncbi:hypothetical protein [Microbispora rosea]|uniref:hypothetical protein n=1 Tax=Microbispora rosea TaxID=58117 RepID=UPI003442C3D8
MAIRTKRRGKLHMTATPHVPITVKVGCVGEPDPDPELLRRDDLYGFACATPCPSTATVAPATPTTRSSARPPYSPQASSSHRSVSNSTARPGQPARRKIPPAIYSSLLGKTADKPTLYTKSGWRWAQLEQSVPVAQDDRFIWLFA